MKYCVVLNALSNLAQPVMCAEETGVLQTCYDLIDCDTIQLVPLYPGRLPKGYIAVCDEDTYGKMEIFNPLASWLYGTDEHGQPIVRDAVILKETEEDMIFMEEDEARKLSADLNEKAEEVFNKTMNAVIMTLNRK